MVSRRSSALTPERGEPLVYTAQDVAHFCEVDLKTIHHWADAGKIPHRRTEGRHLRFRRNHVLAFLRAHGYPLPSVITTQKPTVFFASVDPLNDDATKKIGAKFFVRRFENAVLGLARIVADEPDAFIVLANDPTWTEAAHAAIAADPELNWVHLVVTSDVTRLHLELAKALDVA